ncbi:MAG: hypothetical protein WB952_24700 [Terriglobales bacterium]
MDFLPRLLQAIAFIPGIVSTIESLLGRRSGTEKKDAVMSLLQTSLSLGDAVMRREIVDDAKFRAGLSTIINGVVDCLNASVWSKTQADPGSPAGTASISA